MTRVVLRSWHFDNGAPNNVEALDYFLGGVTHNREYLEYSETRLITPSAHESAGAVDKRIWFRVQRRWVCDPQWNLRSSDYFGKNLSGRAGAGSW